jgi:hypothetical protein
MIDVPFIAKEKIEEEASHLLTEAYNGLSLTLDGPVDIEAIIECYLGLSVDYAPLESEILGALYVAEKQVEINESILPDNDKRNTGIFNFTLAHEVGHYTLHAPLLAANSQNIICRKKDKYLTIEWQANFFASSLLMPREPFIKAFDENYRDSIYRDAERLIVKCFADKKYCQKILFKGKAISPDTILDEVFAGLAQQFAVSPRAAVIRLKHLGLVAFREDNQRIAC